MKQKILILAATSAMLLTLTQQSLGQSNVVRGGTLVVAMNTEPAGLDPSLVAGAEIRRMMHQNVLEGLLGFNEAGKIIPLLASALPSVSSDGLTYTFKLRAGIKFHNGSALSSKDVKTKFDFARTEKSGQQSPTYYAGILDVQTPDANTVVFKLDKTNVNFTYSLADAESIIEPSELFSTPEGREALKAKPIGTGPFALKAWNRGANIQLERNASYWQKGLPYLDAVTFRFMGDNQNAKVAALKAGDIDVIGYNVPEEQAKALAADPTLRIVTGVSTGEITISMNMARKPFSDIRFRKALTAAIDKKEIVNGAFFGYGTVIGSFNSPGQPYFIDLAGKYPYNPELAKQLLAQAGYNGETLKFTVANEFPTERRTAEVVVAQLAKVGVQVEIELVPFNTWIQKVFLGKEYDMTIIGHAEANDLDRYARDGYYFNYNNKEFQALYAKASSTVDSAQRTRLFWQMQTKLANDAPGIWVFSAAYIAATRANVYGWWKLQPVPNMNVIRVYKTK